MLRVNTGISRVLRSSHMAILKLQHIHTPDSDCPQLRGLAILALRGAPKFFAVLNVLGEDFMKFWREHDELFNRFPEEFKNSKSSHPVPFIFVLYCLIVCFKHLWMFTNTEIKQQFSRTLSPPQSFLGFLTVRSV